MKSSSLVPRRRDLNSRRNDPAACANEIGCGGACFGMPIRKEQRDPGIRRLPLAARLIGAAGSRCGRVVHQVEPKETLQ